MSDENENAPQKPRRRWVFLTVVILASAIAGGVITKAAQHFAFKRFHHAYHTMDKAGAERKAERMASFFAKRVNATADQKAKLVTISKSLVSDLLPYRDKMKNTKGQIRELLTQDTIDRAKIETLRAEKFALMENISKRVTTALTDVAEVLTPEQRKKVSEHLLRKRHHWR